MRRGPQFVRLLFMATLSMSLPGLGLGRESKVEAVFDGDPMYRVLPRGGIPAIIDPDFVGVQEAGRFLAKNEPVFGIVIGGQARAYSLWHLDHHEVVNDSAGGVDFAVTW